MKTPEDILTKLSKERGYPSFPALIENELSLDVYDLVCKAMNTPEEKYIKITITEKDSEQIIDLKSKGLYDYEIVGLLTHYRDKMQILMLNKTDMKNENT